MLISGRSPSISAAIVIAGLLFPSTAGSQDKPALNAIPEEGLFVPVSNPITTAVVDRIRSQILARQNGQARPVRTIVFDFNPGGKDVANSDFGACYGLAEYIGKLRANTITVAFVHARTTGHTVLPVLACKELIMSENAMLGEIASDTIPPPDNIKIVAYQSIAEDRKAQWAAIRKMYDKNIDLVEGTAKPGGAFSPGTKVYVDRSHAEAEKVGGLTPLTFGTVGQVALYTADQARQIGLCKAFAASRSIVAELYSLSPASIQDSLFQDQPNPYKYTLSGDVDGAMRESVNRIIRDVKRKKGNFLLLTVNCSGGDLAIARSLADDLRAAQTGEDPILIVGFIPDRAVGAGTFLAFGCTDIVMSKRHGIESDDQHEAELGDFQALIRSGQGVEENRKSLKELAERRGYPGILIDGMFDPNLAIVRVQGTKQRTQRRLMSEADFEASKSEWVREKQIKAKGVPLKLNATLAEELGVARYTVEQTDPAEVYKLYGLDPAKVKEVTPSWIDRFAEFLRLPVITLLLVVIGFTGLILELKVPGLTVPGIIAALCFILVFWSQSRFSGETFVLALLLFVMGLVLVGLEIFVFPGFGAPGICGIFCMIAALGLLTFDRVPQTMDEWGLFGMKMVQYLFGMIGAFVLAFTIARFLPNVPYANRMMLTPPNDLAETITASAEAASLLGTIGTASTTLRPAGVVRIADRFIDVVSDGDFIPAGARVRIIAAEGNRIVVKEI